MSGFMEIFVFFITILQFLFPFAFKDTEVPENPGDDTVIEQVHAHTGGFATCFTPAVCTVCGEVYGDIGDHIYDIVVTPATCKTQGYSTYTCKACTETFVADVTPLAEHKYIDTVVKPTCTEEGYTKHTCRVCTASIEDTVTAALGHEMRTNTVEPTCTEDGYKQDKCLRCGYTEEKYDITAAIGHSIKDIVTEPTCFVDGYTTHACKNCSYKYTDTVVEATGHNYKTYTVIAEASCKSSTIKEAVCENGCGIRDTVDMGDRIPHKDDNNDYYCDFCETSFHIEYTYLQYTPKALATINSNLTLDEFIGNADSKDGVEENSPEFFEINSGTTYNSVITSPYFTVKIKGKVNGSPDVANHEIPVYGTAVYVGESGKGALHSFSEIYIEKGAYETFEIEITGVAKYITIKNAVVLPEKHGDAVEVKNGKAYATLTGFGAHTFLFNDGDQAYAYTITVREEVDEDAEIAELKRLYGEGNVYVVGDTSRGDYTDAYVTDYDNLHYVGQQNLVIYLRKGSYLSAQNKYNITSLSDLNGNADEGLEDTSVANNGIGLNRWGYINPNHCTNFIVMGYGAIDLGRLDRGERRGVVIANSQNVTLRGVKLFNSCEWTCVVYNSTNVTIKDVDVYGYRQNSDAFDICNSRGVTVDGCFTRTGDDGFVVKALGGGENAITNGVNISNSYAWVGKARAFGIFGEVYKDIKNVTFDNCTVLIHDAAWDKNRIPAIGIVAENTEDKTIPITVENIIFNNFEICRNDARAIDILVFDQIPNVFNINNVTFSNIRYKNNAQKILIDKYGANSSVSDVTFKNVYCNNVLLTMDNRPTYFEAASYEGGYINFENE